LTRFVTTIFASLWPDRDILTLEIPIERPDKCIHSEILIIAKKMIKPTFKQQPHIDKLLVNITPNMARWTKELPLQIFGEN
jgi:hypothetical protein